jgi:small neutral amino acid transporter SnatA (MarC family)
VKEFTRPRAVDSIAARTPLPLGPTAARLDRVHVLAVVLALGLIAYLGIEPTQNWLLLLLSGLAALGTDAVVRQHPKARFHRLDDTALFLFVPVLFTLGLGLFLEEVAEGYWTVGVGLLSAIPYWFILRAEYDSVDRRAESYHSTRLVLNLATYVIAFLFFATIYDFDLSLLTSAFAAGIVSFLLAIEVLREEEMDTSRTMFYALAIGLLLAETAWATHFLPIDGSAAAVFLLLALYLMTGMMHNYLGDRLNLRTASEFTAVALAGLLVVTVSHSYI